MSSATTSVPITAYINMTTPYLNNVLRQRLLELTVFSKQESLGYLLTDSHQYKTRNNFLNIINTTPKK